MRRQPIEKPKGLMLRIAYWMTRRKFGKVMTPLKVITARIPQSVRLSYSITKFELRGIRLDPTLHFLVGTLTAQINGCGFCADLGRATSCNREAATRPVHVADGLSGRVKVRREEHINARG